MIPEIKIDVKNLLPNQQLMVLAISGYIKSLSMSMERASGPDRQDIKDKYDTLLDLMNKLRIVVEMDSISADIFGGDRAPSYRTTKEAIERVLEGLVTKIATYGNLNDSCAALLKPVNMPDTTIRTGPLDMFAPQRSVQRQFRSPIDPTNPMWPEIAIPGLPLPSHTITS